MADNNLDCLLVNSTNEFLVEYNTLQENSRYKLTGFSGSTGDVLITKDNVFLFVDGRYHIQADQEVDHRQTTVVKLQIGQTFLGELLLRVPQNSVLGVFSKKVSQKFVELLEKNVTVRFFDEDPLDDNNADNTEKIEVLDSYLTGLSTLDKIKKLNIDEDSALLLTNLEDVSYLFNLRCFSMQYSAKIKAKAIVFKDRALLYMADKLDDFKNDVIALGKKIYIDKASINAYDYNLVKDRAVEVSCNPISSMKSVKTSEEIESYIDAFNRTDKAVLATREYIENTPNISEYDIAEHLEQEFYKNGAKSLSFKSIVAKDKNSALAHYSKCSKNEILKDGSLVLIDCGAYFESGLATDITRVFVKGNPTDLQKRVYTTVLKAFLNAYNTKMDNTCGFDIDNSTREFFTQNPVEGFVFNHGLGHGIGINVHEAPPSLSNGEIAKTIIEENMCFTIEPGLYNVEHFGVRLENSCYLKDGKIRSFVHVPYEKKLINYDMLTSQEKLWLDEFGVI